MGDRCCAVDYRYQNKGLEQFDVIVILFRMVFNTVDILIFYHRSSISTNVSSEYYGA